MSNERKQGRGLPGWHPQPQDHRSRGEAQPFRPHSRARCASTQEHRKASHMLVVACTVQAVGRPLACEVVHAAGQGWLWACLSSHLPQQPSAECHRWATSARGSQLPGASWSSAPTGNLGKWKCRCREQGRVVHVRLAATGPPPYTLCRGGPCRGAEGGGVTTSRSCFCAWREGGDCDRCTAQQDTGSPWEAQRAASWTTSQATGKNSPGQC